MTDFNSTSALTPVGQQRTTAVLHIAYAAVPPDNSRNAQRLLERVAAAAGRQMHLADIVREFGPSADDLVARLLAYPLAFATLTWTAADGRRVYAGSLPQKPVLPVGQCYYRSGFRLDDYLHNARPTEPVRA